MVGLVEFLAFVGYGMVDKVGGRGWLWSKFWKGGILRSLNW